MKEVRVVLIGDAILKYQSLQERAVGSKSKRNKQFQKKKDRTLRVLDHNLSY